MGRPPQRQSDINWESLQLQTHDLSDLDVPFTDEELKGAIQQMTSDKAPGPDGFTGAFLSNAGT